MVVLLGCAATILAGTLARSAGHRWGVPLAPFFATWSPRVDLAAIPAVALFAVAVLLTPALLRHPASPAAFGVGALALGLVLRLALAAARGGPARWSAVFGGDPEAAHEYLPALPALAGGLHPFLAHFAALAPQLPTHASGHPPGMLVALHLLRIDTATGMAALCILAGACAIPLTYALARALGSGERTARVAALFFAFAPSALLYGATSADALYATLGVAAAVALMRRGRRWAMLGPAALAIASFFSFALLGVGAWVVLIQLVRGERARAARTALGAAIGVLAFYALLYAATGFDVIATFHALSRDYRTGIANIRPYAFWLFGSPVAYLVALGLPLAWLAARALAAREAAALALAVVLAISALLGFTKAETERIWLFLVPFACIVAAGVVSERRLRPISALLALQAFTVELLVFTVW